VNKATRIFVAGHRGLVGAALVRRLQAAGYENLVTVGRDALDLRDHGAVEAFFERTRPEVVLLAAARVGGIHANNTYPAQFLYDNLAIQINVIEAARRFQVGKLLFLGSSCIYPRDALQPMSEDCLLTGPLEPTNEAYAIAKIAGIKMCQAYRREYGLNAISAMPTNLYGPGDNFSREDSHVLPALLRKFHEAVTADEETVDIWGTGTPRREFLHVDDLADACLYLLQHYDDPQPINVGWGEDVSIAELAALIARVVGFKGRLVFDRSRPDGTPRKLLDTRRLGALGWQPRIRLEAGIEQTYRWYQEHVETVRA
jgi:GDP-L-fucose synthase